MCASGFTLGCTCHSSTSRSSPHQPLVVPFSPTLQPGSHLCLAQQGEHSDAKLALSSPRTRRGAPKKPDKLTQRDSIPARHCEKASQETDLPNALEIRMKPHLTLPDRPTQSQQSLPQLTADHLLGILLILPSYSSRRCT